MNEIVRKDLLDILTRINIEKLRNKTLLVTGSNGLIGTYLISLIYLANQEKGLNTKVLGVSRNHPNKTLLEFSSDKNFKFYTKNLAETFNILEEPDYIIHAACYAQPKKFLENPIETIKLNTETTEHLLKLAMKKKAGFLFISSSEIYGQPDPSNIPTPETYNGNCSPLADRALYMESKRLGETICKIYKENFGVDVKIARASSIFGPGISIHDPRVLGNFLNKALNKGHIDLMDQGDQERTWCYISDCTLMLFNLLLHGKDFVYNVGGKELVSIRQMAEIIAELTNARVSVPEEEHKENFVKGAPSRVEVDITKITEEFNLGNFITFKQGIKNTIEWNRIEFLK